MKIIKKVIIFSVLFSLLTLPAMVFSLPKLFLFLGGSRASEYESILDNPYVSGAQIIYSWKQLEPKKGVYDFSKMEADLRFLTKIHKKLFIQVQDRSFQPDVFPVPNYLREDEIYHGGVAMQYDVPGEGKPLAAGWVSRVWDSAVQERFQRLIAKIALEFDGKIYGINLPETSVDFDKNHLPEGFTSEKYFVAELQNLKVTREAFKRSLVIQYVNFFPDEWNNDHHYMSRLFSFAKKYQVGLGGPDVVPYKNVHMKNSYPFFHRFKDTMLTGMAIQEPDYTYRNPETGDFYKFSEFYTFTQNYLGASILFWNVQEPFFSKELTSRLTHHYFEHA